MIWQDTNPATCARCSVRLSSYDPALPPVCGRCAEIHAPYRIKPKDKNAGGPFKVVNDLGEVKGTHDTWDEARQQQEALYVNVPGASEMAEEKHKKDSQVTEATEITDPKLLAIIADARAHPEKLIRRRMKMAYDMESDPERYNICDCGHSKAQHEDGTGACTMPNCTDGGCDEYIEEFFEDEEPPTGSKWIPGIPSTSGRTASEGTWSVGSNPNHSRYTAPDTSTVATVAMGSSVGGMPEAKDDDWVWWVEGYGDDGEDGEWDTLAEGIANSEEAAKTAALAVFEKYSY